MQLSHHSFPKGRRPFVRANTSESLYLSLYSRHRLRNDEDWQAAIPTRQKRFPSDVTTNGPIEGNRSDFAIRDPNRPGQLFRFTVAAARRSRRHSCAVGDLQDTLYNLLPPRERSNQRLSLIPRLRYARKSSAAQLSGSLLPEVYVQEHESANTTLREEGRGM